MGQNSSLPEEWNLSQKMKLRMQPQSDAFMSANEIISNMSQHKHTHANIPFCTLLFFFTFWYVAFDLCLWASSLSALVVCSMQRLHQELIKDLRHSDKRRSDNKTWAHILSAWPHTRLKYLHLLNPLNNSEVQCQTQVFLTGIEEPQKQPNEYVSCQTE